MRALIFLVMVAFLACAKNDGPIFTEVVALDPSNPINFALTIVKADPLNNIFSSPSDEIELSSLVKVRLSEIALSAQTSNSFAENRAKLRERFGGEPADLLYTKSDGVYRGATYESILGLSAYYHLVEIVKFAKKLSLLDDITLGPLRVSLLGEIYANKESLYPFPTNDNALYIGSADLMMLLPIGENDGLPVPMHEGVLAHELHHRIFFYRVWVNNENKESWQRYKARYQRKRDDQMTRSDRLLAATDEALADIFAIAYTGLANYLCLSLTTVNGDEVCKQRDLKGEFAQKATYDILAGKRAVKELRGSCAVNSMNFTSQNFNYYCLATVIAKAIFEASNQDGEILRASAIPAISRSLQEIAQFLAQGKDYDLEAFWEAFAKESKIIDEDFHRRLCEQLATRFSSLISKGKVLSCKRS